MKKILLFLCLLGTSLLFAETTETWSREIQSSLGKIKIFQPEVETLSDNTMESRSTVIFEKEGQKPVFGAIWFESSISTDFDERKITLDDAEITASQFPQMDENETNQIHQIIEKDIPNWDLEFSLDELLATIQLDQIKMEQGIKNTPPTVLFATTPTALIIINGKPIFKDIENTELKYVVNTPFLIVQDKNSDKLYLKGGKYWYTSDDMFEGWHFAEQIPSALLDLDKNKDQTPEDTSSQIISNFIVKTVPTELLMSNGNPEFAPVKNTGLLYMTNTDDDIILNIETQEYFTLLAGRWYKSSDLFSNDWSFVSPDSLPIDFYSIGSDTPISNVRVHIPGTIEAKTAVLETQIPQTAEIDRHSTSYSVTYDGKPTFKKIQGTDILYAINTEKDVLLVDGVFYSCDNGIWFESKDANGPWSVSVLRPNGIEDISPEYPIHRVKYVYIFDYTPDIVTVGYYSGYMQSYVYRGTVFYGSGYYYQPWYRNYYYARPLTYGFGAHYSTRSGWSFSYGLSFGGNYWLHDNYFYRSYYRGFWGNLGYNYHPVRPHFVNHNRGFYKNRKMPANYRNIETSPRYKMAGKPNNLYLKKQPQGIKRTGNSYFDSKSGKQVKTKKMIVTPRSASRNTVKKNTFSNIKLKNSSNRREQWKNVTPKSQNNRDDVYIENNQRDNPPQNKGKINLFENKSPKEERRVENNSQRNTRSEARSENRRRSEKSNNNNNNQREERRIDRRGR